LDAQYEVLSTERELTLAQSTRLHEARGNQFALDGFGFYFNFSFLGDIVAAFDFFENPTLAGGVAVIGGLVPGVSSRAAREGLDELETATDTTRDRIISNIARSREARASSNFADHVAITQQLDFSEEIVGPNGIVYLRTDITGRLAPYGGQAINDARYLARQGEHARAFPNSKFEFEIVNRANPGTDLYIAEQNFVQELTGGVAARLSPDVSNLRDPVGPARRPAFGLPEPK
jgi:hypothetical protein